MSGWSAGDTLDACSPFGAGTMFVYTENSDHKSGVLKLTDGTMHASINFLGDYSMGNFATAGHGGSVFTFRA